MSTIEVAVQGIIMFVATSVYGGTGTETGAALAVRAPTAVTGKYGIELPAHVPQLRFKKIVMDGACKAPFADDGKEDCLLDLTGYRIELGNYADGACKPLSGIGARGDMEGVPEFEKITTLPTTTLAAKARPTMTNPRDYKDIDPDLIAGWLDIPKGDMLSKESQRPGEAEFRPSLYPYRPALEARWIVDAGDAVCLQVTPFGGSPSVVRFKNLEELEIEYFNLPQVAGTGHVHGRRGASYDFELFYKILVKQPDIPPVPHYLREMPTVNAGDEGRQVEWVTECVTECLRKRTVDPHTGENCGPGKNNKP